MGEQVLGLSCLYITLVIVGHTTSVHALTIFIHFILYAILALLNHTAYDVQFRFWGFSTRRGRTRRTTATPRRTSRSTSCSGTSSTGHIKNTTTGRTGRRSHKYTINSASGSPPRPAPRSPR